MAQEYIEGFQKENSSKAATTTGPGTRYAARGDTKPPSSNEDAAYNGLTRGDHEGVPAGNPFGIGAEGSPRDVQKTIETPAGIDQGLSRQAVRTFGRTIGRSLAGEHSGE
jgi:hypothetical protein